MRKYYLYIIVSISGASVLALEILGTRILGPFYGVSLFLWSALITVTLAALSVGYAIGGRIADNSNSNHGLAWIIGGAGIWTLLIPWLKDLILIISEPVGLRFAVLIASFLLFFPPLMLLGMVSPYAIKLKTIQLTQIGRTAGNLYAVSTLASVFAALITGFFLIPYVGVTLIILIIGVLLLLGSGLGLYINKNYVKFQISLIMIFIALTGYLLIGNQTRYKGLIFEEQSPYGEVRVIDKEGKRYLLIDGAVHTIIDTTDWESYQNHIPVMDINKYMLRQPGSMLLVGLGGGSLANSFLSDGWSVDAVEIDPVIIKVAKKYFNLRPEVKIYLADGRQFLTTCQKNYDVIIMDAFGSSTIPFHLITLEAFDLILNRLNPQGIFSVNIETVGWESNIVKAIAATLKQQFNNLYALPLHEPPDALGNVVLMASNRTLEFDEEWLGNPEDYINFDLYEHWLVVQKNHAWYNRFEPELKNTQILTDNLNPIDSWAEEANLAARKDLHNFFFTKKQSR